MIQSSKAIAANTDLSSAQAFIFRGAEHSYALIISASFEDIFLKIKQAVLEVEAVLQDETQTIPLKFAQVHQSLAEKLQGVDELQVMIASWSEDILYIQSRGHYYAILQRDGKPINLITPQQHDQLVSGHILPGDKILLGTQSLTELTGDLAGDNKELEFLIKDPIDDFQDQLNILILDKPHLDPIGAVLLEVERSPEQKLANPALQYQEDAFDYPPTASLHRRFPLPRLPFKPNLSLPRRRLLLPLLGAVLLILIGALIFSRLIKKSPKSLAPSPSSQSQASPSPAVPTNTIKDWPLYLSLDLIKDKFTSKRLSESLNNFLLFGSDVKTLVLLDKKNKTNQILAGSRQLGSALAASLNGDFAFTYAPDKGVVRVDIQNQKDSVVIKPDSDWGKISDLFAFGSNVYLLDSAKNQIWKYVPVAAGYSDKNAYFKEGSSVSIADATRIQIDSSIWILKGTTEIDRFTSGAPDFYSVGGLDTPIKRISTFFVSDETDNVYIIDSDNSRLVITDKTGKFVSQYTGDKFKTADDLVVDETAKKLYLLDGNKIYLIDLK